MFRISEIFVRFVNVPRVPMCLPCVCVVSINCKIVQLRSLPIYYVINLAQVSEFIFTYNIGVIVLDVMFGTL